MRVTEKLSTAFCKDFNSSFEDVVAQFLVKSRLLPDEESLTSTRFLSRSVLPHVLRLSELFNRLDIKEVEAAPKGPQGLDEYWAKGSNPANLRLAYFLYFMPSNLFRVAAIWNELLRLGYRWKTSGSLRAIDFGSGPATGMAGIAAGEAFSTERSGMPVTGNWALIEQDPAMLKLGTKWVSDFQSEFLDSEYALQWETRPFHRKIAFDQPTLLPPKSPKFHLWVMSYFLNEVSISPKQLATILLETWKRHLEEDGIVILVEPALKEQSRRLLEIRKEILEQLSDDPWLKVLLPCLGHQACGALAKPEDWCHEDVSWWRPSYFKIIDQMAELDRKSLPFSYLVLYRGKSSIEDVLPKLKNSSPDRRRLVSPAHFEKKNWEFYVCGQDGKFKARYRATSKDEEKTAPANRGDILSNPHSEKEDHYLRINKVDTIG
ncbi:small ribosomal subunit Rsm22 family protein [bacterium]|jgi:hypothetical protein|nr:small ribosomal subunit Rsm22 family protein [bacterium]